MSAVFGYWFAYYSNKGQTNEFSNKSYSLGLIIGLGGFLLFTILAFVTITW